MLSSFNVTQVKDNTKLNSNKDLVLQGTFSEKQSKNYNLKDSLDYNENDISEERNHITEVNLNETNRTILSNDLNETVFKEDDVLNDLLKFRQIALDSLKYNK